VTKRQLSPTVGDQIFPAVAPVYVDGKLVRTLRGDHIAEEFHAMLEEYVDRTYPASQPVGVA
jgi:4-hydroxy-3-methylbut-2-en-1-yl diphosphate synthase IspG/GcpE